MQTSEIEKINNEGLSKNKKMFLFWVLLLCFTPLILNLVGIDFSSQLTSSDALISEQLISTSVTENMFGSLHHVVLDWSAVFFAMLAALVSFYHYRVKQNIIVPIIGLALLSVGLVDVIHTLAAAKIITAESSTIDFLPFTWALSRIFNALTLLFVAVYSLRYSKNIMTNVNAEQCLKLLMSTAAFFIIVVAIIFWGTLTSSHFPQTIFPKAFITRPYDILPLAIFLCAAVFYWLWFNEKKSILRYTLVLSMIPQVIAQFHMAYGSTALYDNDFNIAHLLKIIAYGSILFGLVIDIFEQDITITTNENPHQSSTTSIQYTAKNMGLDTIKWPLAFKIPLVGFIFSLMISLIIAFTFYVESYQLVSEKEMNKLSLEAEIIKPLFNKFYGQSAQDISFLSATPPIQGMMLAKKAKDETLFAVWQQRLNSIFVELLKTKAHYQRMSFITVSASNDVVVSAKRINNKVVGLTNDELVKNIKLTSLKPLLTTKKNQIYFSAMSFDSSEDGSKDHSRDHSSFFVAFSIIDSETNTIFGIVAIEVDLLSYIEELKARSLEDVNFYIADEKGEFLYYPSKKSLTQTSTNIKQEFPIIEQYINQGIDSAEIYEFEKHNDTIGLAFFSKVNFEFIARVPPLYLLIENHNDEFLTAIQNMRFRVVIISLSLAFICLMLSIYAARKLVKPLSNMTENLARYEKRGTIGELPINEKDEIGLLARSFNHLFGTIEHKSSQLKLVATEAESANLKLQAILNSIGDAVITINTEGQILGFNKSARSMFGYPESEVINQNVKMLMPISFANNHDKYIKDHLLTGQSKILGVGRELPAVRKNGDVFHMHLTINEVVTEDGTIYTGLIRDITESRRLEVEKKRILTEAKNAAWRLNFALSAPGIGVWDFDLATKQILWDERMYLLFAVDPKGDDTPKQLWKKMTHPDDRERVEQLISEAIEQDKEIQYQHRITLPNNKIRYIEAHAQVMLDEKGDKVSIVGTYRDNTEQQQLQILKQEALDMAEESLRLKSEFLASMSHEIRTPMNGVLGMLGLLEQSALSKQQAHQVSLANSSAHSLLALINDILDFSKIEAGKLELEVLDFDIRRQFGELAESMAIRAQEKNLELILDLTQITDSMVKGDPSRLRQILSNLVGNAIKFTNSGEVVIKAAVKEQDSQLQLICKIIDTGIGIPADKINQLFDSFTQVDATTTRKYGGTGLGLAIVKQLCDLMGGEVSIESEINKGCCITFSLNLEKSEGSKTVGPVADIVGLEILVVDDNKTNLNVLSCQLKIWGANVTQAQSASEALDIIEQAEKGFFSIIFIDKHMSNTDGISLGQQINHLPKASGSQLVLMTHMNEKVDSEFISSVGFIHCFPKPVTTNDLIHTLTVTNNNHIEGNEMASNNYNPLNVVTDSQSNKLPKNSKILLVEDNRINQAVILGILANIHLHADVAENGLVALALLMNSARDDDYQLIIMDCQMPELDGYETTKMIRKGEIGKRYQVIPIIAMTANAMKGDEDKCFAAGMSDYATKPVDPTILQQKLCHWLGERDQDTVEVSDEIEHKVTTQTTSDDLPIDSQVDNSAETDKPEKSDNLDTSSEIWQKTEFLNRIRNNMQLAQNLITLFIEDSPGLLTQLIAAIESNDPEDIVHFSHKLKGSARNLGGNKLGGLCEYIENNPRDIAKEQVSLHKQSLKNEFDLLIQALQNFSKE